MENEITPGLFIYSLKKSCEYLKLNYHILNNINVFPVADGDTGVNMFNTYRKMTDAISSKTCSRFSDIYDAYVNDSLISSFGNSGVILANFFLGFLRVLKDYESLTSESFIHSFKNGCYHAKISLLNPVDGTIITVISNIAESLDAVVSEKPVDCLLHSVEIGRRAVFITPQLLPVLAASGVVDAGGLGFVFILTGMYKGLAQIELEKEDERQFRFTPDTNIQIDSRPALSYRYCTEICLRLNEPLDRTTRSEFLDFLKTHGDSIATIELHGIYKIHIHTDEPNTVVDYFMKTGKIESKKIDDMERQIQAKQNSKANNPTAVFAVIPGAGIENVFAELGATDFIIYADGHPPHPAEIMERIENHECSDIILLANNEEVVAGLARMKQSARKRVYILPTSNVVEGINAMYNFSSTEDAPSNFKAMSTSPGSAHCLILKRMDSDGLSHGQKTRRDGFCVTHNDHIIAAGDNVSEVIRTAMDEFDLSEIMNISVYRGIEMKDSVLQEMGDEIMKKADDISFSVEYCGQKDSLAIIALE